MALKGLVKTLKGLTKHLKGLIKALSGPYNKKRNSKNEIKKKWHKIGYILIIFVNFLKYNWEL
jgi:hypothetical protein